MKKTKLIAPLISAASCITLGSIVPLVTTSCSCSENIEGDKIVCTTPAVDTQTDKFAIFYFKMTSKNLPKRFKTVHIDGKAKYYLSIAAVSDVDREGNFTVKITLLDSVEKTDWIHYFFSLIFFYGEDSQYTVEDLVFQYNEYGEHDPEETGGGGEAAAEEAAGGDNYSHQAPVIQYGSSWYALKNETIITINYKWIGQVPDDESIIVGFDTVEGTAPEWLTILDENGSEVEETFKEIHNEGDLFTVQIKIKENSQMYSDEYVEYANYMLFKWFENGNQVWATPESEIYFAGYGDQNAEKPLSTCNESNVYIKPELGEYAVFHCQTNIHEFGYQPECVVAELVGGDNLTLCVLVDETFVIPDSRQWNAEVDFAINNDILDIYIGVTINDPSCAELDTPYIFNLNLFDHLDQNLSTGNDFAIIVQNME